ncbi:hypothetical protein NEOLEDRAFT_1022228, partial [Neolentinus lepideus HHB14362 ss-1]
STTLQSYVDMLAEISRREGNGHGIPGSSQRKRSSSVASSHSDESGGESESKRRRPDPSKFAWKVDDILAEAGLRPDVIRTLDLLRNYGKSVKYSVGEILLSPNCPEFPEGEWYNILGGHAVDLDKVFSGIYATSRENITVGRIGDIRLEHKDSAPAHRITNAHQWNNAWQRTIRATTFAFPHRRRELDEYGAWISATFMSLNEKFHTRVLDFDKAIRKCVGSQRSLLLTDFYLFEDLRNSHIFDHGAAVALKASSTGGGGTSGPMRNREAKSSDPCNRWNKGLCPSGARACRYRHVCFFCRSGSHTRAEC